MSLQNAIPSLGSPLRPAPAKPTNLPAIHTGRDPSTPLGHPPRLLQATSVPSKIIMDESPGLPYAKNINTLAEYLRMRPLQDFQFKVIAVDGNDVNCVRYIMSCLQHNLATSLGFPVKTLNDDFKFLDLAGMPQFLSKVQCWGAMWDAVSHAPPMSKPPMPASAPKAPRGLYINDPCVFIFPLSPLTATLQAMETVPPSNGRSADEHFRWLASHFGGLMRPDIVVSIHENDPRVDQHEVQKLCPSNMKTVLVGRGRGIDFRPKQLRRMTFEVQEWVLD